MQDMPYSLRIRRPQTRDLVMKVSYQTRFSSNTLLGTYHEQPATKYISPMLFDHLRSDVRVPGSEYLTHMPVERARTWRAAKGAQRRYIRADAVTPCDTYDYGSEYP